MRASEFERVIVDITVQEKAIAHRMDSCLLEITRHKVAAAAKRAGIALKQTFACEGKRRKAGGYGCPKQFRRLRKTLKRQRTIPSVAISDDSARLNRILQGRFGNGTQLWSMVR